MTVRNEGSIITSDIIKHIDPYYISDDTSDRMLDQMIHHPTITISIIALLLIVYPDIIMFRHRLQIAKLLHGYAQ
jgi:hypothetical protein